MSGSWLLDSPLGAGDHGLDAMDLMIGALAGAADKTAEMTVDAIAYTNNWLLHEDAQTLLALDTAGNVLDDKGRKYYNYGGFTDDRQGVYGSKCVKITALDYNSGLPGTGTDGTFVTEIVSLYDKTINSS